MKSAFDRPDGSKLRPSFTWNLCASLFCYCAFRRLWLDMNGDVSSLAQGFGCQITMDCGRRLADAFSMKQPRAQKSGEVMSARRPDIARPHHKQATDASYTYASYTIKSHQATLRPGVIILAAGDDPMPPAQCFSRSNPTTSNPSFAGVDVPNISHLFRSAFPI